MKGKLRAALMAAVCMLGLSGCVAQSTGTTTTWYAGQNGISPTGGKVYICHGFGCAYKTPVTYSAADLRRIRNILARGRSSPAAERTAIGRAVQWQEKRVAGEAGSHNDVGGFDAQNALKPGQMDCIDESTNTTSLLLLAEKHGYLKHHRVSAPVARGFFLDGRYPHATATVTEKTSGQVFAVDSWVRANGARPDILPLEVWMEQGSRLGGS